MKTWRLISGILSMILFVLVSFQSCAAGALDAMAGSEGTSGAAGILVGIDLLAGGIISIVSKDSHSKGFTIVLIILYGLGAFIGFTMHGSYTDLVIWSAWCLLNALMAVISLR